MDHGPFYRKPQTLSPDHLPSLQVPDRFNPRILIVWLASTLFLISLLISVAFCAYGSDVSVLVSKTHWQCLKDNGHSFACPRIYRSNGLVDTNAAANIRVAKQVGLSLEGYIFPCPKCSKNATVQMNEAVDNLRNNGVSIDRYWLDIEGGTQFWSSDKQKNVHFISEAAAALERRGVAIGVYTSASQWSPICGTWTGLSKYPVWYAHYDHVPTFADWKPFGGWGKPNTKQYEGDVTQCGVSLDKNWRP